MTRMPVAPRRPRRGAFLVAAAAVLALGACGQKKDAGATQVAAKVNGDEITVHQINFVLQQQRNLRPEQADAASRELLERLIDQQLEMQKAIDAKLDRDPQTVQMLEAARREILARRYLETVAEKSAKPSDAETQKYFDTHPALFSERKIYTLQRTDVQVPPGKGADVVAHVEAAKSAADLQDWLKSQDIKFSVSPMTQPAEGLPLQLLDRIAALKDGQSIAVPQQFAVAVLTVVARQSEPKTLEQSRGVIQQFLSVESRRTAVSSMGKSLREGAKIQYEGKFAASTPAMASAHPPAASAVAHEAPAAVAASAASGMDEATLKKGLGLK